MVVNDEAKARCGIVECALTENDDFVAGRVRGQSMRVGQETREERSQFGEAINDCQSPNAAGHVSVSTGWR